ncbi:MAG: phosphatase PAP2 family protein [Thermoprotei archaeon]
MRLAKFLGFFLLAVFAIIFLLVITGISQQFDVSLFKIINEDLHYAPLDKFFQLASIYGRSYVWVPVVFLAWVIGSKRYRRGALTMALAFLIVIAVGETLKFVYYRPRPFELISSAIVLLPKPHDSSFPSGHAMIVFAGATISVIFFKKRYSLPLLLEAFIVSYSRVYVGVHYPSDVLAGAALGSAISLLTYYYFYGTPLFERLYFSIESAYDAIIRLIKFIK